MDFIIVLVSILVYFVIARIVSKFILREHIRNDYINCSCTMKKMSSYCFDREYGANMFAGSILWPMVTFGFILISLYRLLSKIVDSPVLFFLDKFSNEKTTTGEVEETRKQSRAIRKANERLELAKIHEQEALALENAFNSNVRLVNMKDKMNPLSLNH